MNDNKLSTGSGKKYSLFASAAYSAYAAQLAKTFPWKFNYFPISWNKFADGTDNISVEGFHPINKIANTHCLFVASFCNNDVTLSQFSVFITLLQSFIESLTIVLPFYPVGTMERVVFEGSIATANTYAMLFSSLPSCGKPTKLITYDIHTLQNRFFFHNNCIASLNSCIPMFCKTLAKYPDIQTIAFPDDGAAKRFSHLFRNEAFDDFVICGKVRVGTERLITIQDGDCENKHIVIVDDLVQSGGTLYQCALALKKKGAASVSAFVPHAVFPNESYKKFLKNTYSNSQSVFDGNKDERGCWSIFEYFWVVNTIPRTVAKLPKNDVFIVLDMTEQILKDID